MELVYLILSGFLLCGGNLSMLDRFLPNIKLEYLDFPNKVTCLKNGFGINLSSIQIDNFN